MKKSMLVIPFLIVAAVAASGCATTPYDGSPPKVDQSRIDAVTASATAWIASDQGADMFPSGMFAGPIAVFNENRTFDHWILPVKDDYGMYLGLFVSKYENFSSTGSATKYPEPRHNIFSKTKDEAYSLMLNSSVYSAYQIKEPYVSVVEGKGYHWTSEVVVDGRHVGRLIFAISVIDPSDADNRLKTPA